jgi:hypothetical protein
LEATFEAYRGLLSRRFELRRWSIRIDRRYGFLVSGDAVKLSGRFPGVLPLLAALSALLVVVPAAQASFHLIKVREVFPGTTAHPNSGYVELQMYASGQNLVQLGNLKAYGPTGTVTDTFTPGSSVTAAANQSTVLIADTEYAAQFPSGPSPDFTDSALNLSPAGGAVCWPQNEPPFDDCASWGNFSGQAQLASTDSAPAAAGGIPDGMAIRRSIAGGSCPTLLEEADDTNNSSADFALVSPSPRANATIPIETACVPAVIDTKPANPTKATSASFSYHSAQAGASFECKLDLEAFADCEASGISYPGPLGEGTHTFSVRTQGGSGTTSYSWRVDTTAPAAIIDSHPADPSPGTAAFTFHASEAGSSFECSLAKGAETGIFSSCASGKTYTSLADGEYTFMVRAKDLATNVGAASSFEWQVDKTAADKTPPETTIDSRPPDPSGSSTASFTYSSNEPGSSFECALDGAAFSACPGGGISYSGLGNGPHSFQVRAIDPSGNVDPAPAGFSFSVALPAAPGLAPVASLIPLSAPRLTVAPETTLSAKPGAKTHDRTPTFRFRSSAGASFECAVDKAPFRPCHSPFTTKSLQPGRHTLSVRAIQGGLTDPSPARFSFKVVRGN